MGFESEGVVPAESSGQLPSKEVDTDNEVKAHKFRSSKRGNSNDYRAFFQVIRNDADMWGDVQPSAEELKKSTEGIILDGETHRAGAALYAKMETENEEVASLKDIAEFRATQAESDFFKEQIKKGNNYAPLVIVGAGGVYGTIFSAAALKENPDNPPFGLDESNRRGGIWSISGDEALDTSWWRMNSRNRPERRDKLPIPGTDGNINSLGVESQNLQLPDISSAQYPANNELGRVLTHDNFISNNIIVNAELKKVRLTTSPDQLGDRGARLAIRPNQPGKYQMEYEDRETGERFFVYTDTIVQTTGLGEEKLGFDERPSSTREALANAKKDLEEGVKTPKLLTFLQLVETTTDNREQKAEDFERFGLVGKGDTSKVVQEFFVGIGGIDRGLPAQSGFIKEVVVFGLDKNTREQLQRSERVRYSQSFLEYRRENGGFFRIKPVDGKVIGVVETTDDKLKVVYKRDDGTTDYEIVPRLVTTAGFEDMTDKIYGSFDAEVISGGNLVEEKLNEAITKEGSTIFYGEGTFVKEGLEIDRVEVEKVLIEGKAISVAIIKKDGSVERRTIEIDKPGEEDKFLLQRDQIIELEILGEAPKFEPVIDEEFDNEVPLGQKAEGYDIYKAGACTDLPLTPKEKAIIEKAGNIPENTKSIFRFVRPVTALGRKLAREIPRKEDALNLEQFNQQTGEEIPFNFDGEKKESAIIIPVSEKDRSQRISNKVRVENLVKLIAASKLNVLFPEQLDKIEIGIKRVRELPDGSFSFAIKIDPPLPDVEEANAFEEFLNDADIIRSLVLLTNRSTKSAEISLGLTKQMLDVNKIDVRTIKRDDEEGFKSKYDLLG